MKAGIGPGIQIGDGSWLMMVTSAEGKNTSGSVGQFWPGLFGMVGIFNGVDGLQREYISNGYKSTLKTLQRQYDREFIKNLTGSDVVVKLDNDRYTLLNGKAYCVGRSEYHLMMQQQPGLEKATPAFYRANGVVQVFTG